MLRKPLLTMKFRASMMPMRKPDATMAGMMGTKMSPRVLMARWYHGASGGRSLLDFLFRCAGDVRQRGELVVDFVHGAGAEDDL